MAQPLNSLRSQTTTLSEQELGGSTLESFTEVWKKALAVDEHTFRKRLHWGSQGLVRPAPTGSSNQVVPELLAEPAWLPLFTAAYGGNAKSLQATFARGASDRVQDVGQPLPFEVLYLPFIRVARRQLEKALGSKYAMITEAAHVTLERALLRRLCRIGGQCLYLEFNIFRSANPLFFLSAKGSNTFYTAFIKKMTAGRLWAFFQTYSMVARLCAVTVQLWIDTVAEFVGRMAKDLPLLEKTFNDGEKLGRVKAITVDVSDPHNGGRSVLIPQFENGRCVVYKPRPVGMDQYFAEVLAWLNAAGGLLPVRPLNILNQSTYGWLEYCVPAPCRSAEEVTHYYTRCGMVMCLIYAFRGTDFHRGNLISAGAYPMLIDLEALAAPTFVLPTQHARAEEPPPYTVLDTGLLPCLEVGEGGHIVNRGGIGGAEGVDGALKALSWVAVNTDHMQRVYGSVPHEAPQNVAFFEGKRTQPGQYVDVLVKGFVHTYQLLLKHRATLTRPGGLLSRLKEKTVRFIFRNTRLYGALLERSLHPRFMKDGIRWSLQFESLCKPLLRCTERPNIWPICHQEQQALHRLDIPLFMTSVGGTSLWSTEGPAISDCFARSAYADLEHHFNALREEDCAVQSRHIRGALYAGRATTPGHDRFDVQVLTTGCKTTPQGSESALVHQALAIAEEIRERAVKRGKHHLQWYGLQYIPEARTFQYARTNHSLFDGTPGIGVFFAGLDAVCPKRGYRDLALQAIQPVRDHLAQLDAVLRHTRKVDLGVGTGLGSSIYALVCIARFLKVPDLLDEALHLAACITAPVYEKDVAFDWGSGSAGLLLSLLVLYEQTRESWVLAEARRAGAYLLQARSLHEPTGYRIWGGRDQSDGGYLHGIGGIAYALGRLSVYEGEARTDYQQAITEALAFERIRGLASHQKLKTADPLAAWRYGVTGVAHIRRKTPGAFTYPPLNEALDAALMSIGQAVADKPATFGLGTMGQVELILACADLEQRANAMARLRVRMHTHTDAPTIRKKAYQDVGLFMGQAGMGYGLLRLAFGHRMPSLLFVQ